MISEESKKNVSLERDVIGQDSEHDREVTELTGFDPQYRIEEENFYSLRCRCSCAPSPGPYCK